MSLAPRAVPPALNGWNAAYVESQYDEFRRDPAGVPADVRAFFQGFDLASASGPRPAPSGGALPLDAKVRSLVHAYRRLGHVAAKLDPFGRDREPRPEQLSPSFHGITDAELDQTADGTLASMPGRATVRQIVSHLESVYCGTIGVEFWYIEDDEQHAWLLDRIERGADRPEFSAEQRKEILEQLTHAETFERFCQKRYPGDKRFSLEGSETLIPMLWDLGRTSVRLNLEEIVIGMAHRGRLNVLNNILGKTYEQIFTEFEDNFEPNFADGGGDVKYHRGYSGVRTFNGDGSIHVTMASNPSHLESVVPVVLGRCRAKQRLHADLERRRVLPVLIHGDAALPGQGVVSECLNMAQLKGYTVGGSVHVVINNLIGFTTVPEDARSTRYCTDIARSAECPVFHVNGEDPEACVAMMRIALEYRLKFRNDVFVDLYCYRKYGHNEQDEQSFTQPKLAELIRNQPSTLHTYTQKLLGLGVITEAEAAGITARLDAALEEASQSAKKMPEDPTIDPGGVRWKGFTGTYSHEPAKTAVSRQLLTEVASALGRVPEGFNVNPKLLDNPKLKTRGLLSQRAALATSAEIAHADAELLALGTLLLEGIPVRLSGQDSRRGTFSQRHAVLRDFHSGEPYEPLNNMREIGTPGIKGQEPGDKGSDGRSRQARMCVYDSPLSEESVLGFDYGYSMADPHMLVCWEAQFGDFNNGAQVIIDQYLASSELKWERWSGLVMLLPHGYEGAGPEHSSARLERFLLLCADDNMEVVYPTTAAQHFHMLRRQVMRKFRKPLIVMTPKSMLRVPTSTADDLVRGTFQEIIDDPHFAGDNGSKAGDRKKVRRVILCSGKIYHELAARREQIGREDVAIIRVEQLYPLHTELLKSTLAKYPTAAEKVWVQEEPKNAGAWQYMVLAVKEQLGVELSYIGRDASASPAVGSKHAHKDQQEALVTAAIGAKPEARAGDAKPAAKAAAPVEKVAARPVTDSRSDGRSAKPGQASRGVDAKSRGKPAPAKGKAARSR
jgi:2-oxoglutarate dehydrogenase E1 component